jgi:hypothetical protein
MVEILIKISEVYAYVYGISFIGNMLYFETIMTYSMYSTSVHRRIHPAILTFVVTICPIINSILLFALVKDDIINLVRKLKSKNNEE